jgi:cytidine deaminase
MLTKEEMIEEARKASLNSYSKYSGYAVGASIELKDGTIMHGCNVENAVYGLTMCAERVAMFKMISEGYKREDVVQFGLYVNSDTLGTPCGSCRQVMAELIPYNTVIHMGHKGEQTLSLPLEELLPHAWDVHNLDV